ncbi:MAG: protein translocase subunit SecF [Burkholderiaceae bacterium]|jgi:preprotein translocase subunit SecF|nr:protein translocase subunit SecF [Burkholderiaceae bacterium]
MEFFRIKRDIPFMRYALILNVISLLTFVVAVGFLVFRGLHLSNEFTGGTTIEVSYTRPANLDDIRSTVATLKLGDDVQVQNFGRAQDVIVNLPLRKDVSPAEMSEKLMTLLREKDPEVQLKRVEFVGPQVGDELTRDGLIALAMVVIGIIIYMAFRFEWKYGVAAVLANLHDVVIILGFFACFQWEFSLSVLAAVLAVLGYSVNESVIIFDRVRENFRIMRKASVREVINHAITSTISRTIITHGCTEATVLAMLIFGGPALHNFALALTIGIVCSIYSSVFVAAAIAMWLGIRREDLIKPTREKGTADGAVV